MANIDRNDVVWLAPESGSNEAFPSLVAGQHVGYLIALATSLSQRTSFEGAVTEHLRMSGIYWSWTALHLLLHPTATASVGSDECSSVETILNQAVGAGESSHEASDKQEVATSEVDSDPNKISVVDWVWSCYNEDGSFGGNTGHPGHILYTLSAVQILVMAALDKSSSGSGDKNETNRLLANSAAIQAYVVSLQQPDGSFVGDSSRHAEIDTRFTYCALSTCALLRALQKLHGDPKEDTTAINIPAAVDYILQCRNLDGGFGSCIGAESHAGQVFCCVGALAMAESLHLVSPRDIDLLSWWLCERQVDSGGLNGRPEKQADVCYSWWILSSLSILGRVSWINVDKLALFILQCQDDVDGGIADRPDDMPDVFHTFFGVAGLSLLGHLHRATVNKDDVVTSQSLRPFRQIDPIYALPSQVCQQLRLPGQVLGKDQSKTVEERLQHYKMHCNE